jgi:hypothetical protein
MEGSQVIKTKKKAVASANPEGELPAENQQNWLKLDRVSRPIFVVGPPRSGSSLIESALQVAGIPGFAKAIYSLC